MSGTSGVSGTLVCPLCGGRRGSHVTDTRQCADAVLRLRRCFDCHSLFGTEERADDYARRDATLPVTVFDGLQTPVSGNEDDECPTPSPAMTDDPCDPRLVPSVTDDPSPGPSTSMSTADATLSPPKRKYTRKVTPATE